MMRFGGTLARPKWRHLGQGILKVKVYHYTVDLLFDWFGISCKTTDNFCFYLQNRLIQTSQTGVQQYSDTSPFSIPCLGGKLTAHPTKESKQSWVTNPFHDNRVQKTQCPNRTCKSTLRAGLHYGDNRSKLARFEEFFCNFKQLKLRAINAIV